MPFENLSNYPQPHPYQKVWRYCDYSKLKDIFECCTIPINVHNPRLYFSRIDQMADNHEATLDDISWEELSEDELSDGDLKKARAETYAEYEWMMKNQYYISSWTLNYSEDVRMWNDYTHSKESVSIQTTVGNLQRAFHKEIRPVFMKEIIYYDGKIIPNPTLQQLQPPFHKRIKLFGWEREYRVLTTDSSYSAIKEQSEDVKDSFDWKGMKPHLDLEVDPNLLIEKIFTHPLAGNDFKREVEGFILKNTKLKNVVFQSEIKR